HQVIGLYQGFSTRLSKKQGLLQGILQKTGLRALERPKFNCGIRGFQPNSLKIRAGNFFARAGNSRAGTDVPPRRAVPKSGQAADLAARRQPFSSKTLLFVACAVMLVA